jgi:hypothetical protein
MTNLFALQDGVASLETKIALGDRAIARQMDLIARLADAGADTSRAEKLLHLIEKMQTELFRQRQAMLALCARAMH